MKSFIAIFTIGLLFSACAEQTTTTQLAQSASSAVGCDSLKSKVFDALYDVLDKGKALPSVKKFKAAIKTKLASKELVDAVSNLYEIVNEETKQNANIKTPQEHLKFLIQLEFENTSTATHQILSEKIKSSVQKITSLSDSLGIECTAPAAPAPPVATLPATRESLALFGGHLAFATAYQSCQALDLPEMTTATPDVAGIGLGALNGGGYQRYYASLPDIQRTHYYLQNITYAKNCLAVKNKPLVYDFGGEPGVTSQGLNFFSNAGTGGTALGMDCSAFISSAIAAAGMRYSPKVANKPIFIRQSSYDFIDPKISGWTCFDRVALSQTDSIRAGDIMGVQGHVVMVDRVGADPFGLNQITSLSQCASINYRHFDFSILQSSPSKNSIGINRYIASDYLIEAPLMMTAFEEYAKSACQSKFNGLSVTVANTAFGLIRHKETPECLAPRVALQNEACISSCAEFANELSSAN